MIVPRTCPPEGSIDAKYILVGEAPGKTELLRQKPFVGPAGKLLTKLLSMAGINRSDCYITNVVKEEPARDAFSDKSNYRSSEEYAKWEEFLLEELRQCRGKIIIPIGGVALWALLRLPTITKRRGSIYTHQDFVGRKIIPIIHPSSALRQFLFEYYIIYDLQRARKEADNPRPIPDRNLLVEPTFAQVIDYLERVKQAKEVGFDIETIRTKKIDKFVDWEVSCLSLALSSTDAISIPFIQSDRTPYFIQEHELIIWR